MNTAELNFTEVELRIIHLTADGKCHKPDELAACIDELADRNNLHQVIFQLRKKLQPLGQDIAAQSFGKRSEYRRFRLLVPVDSGT